MIEINTSEKKEVMQNIKTFIIDNFLFGNEKEMVGLSESFMENGIIDSTGILELIEFIEENYSIEVNDDELVPENLDSLENISTFVARKKSA